jgi:hypothetical protein
MTARRRIVTMERRKERSKSRKSCPRGLERVMQDRALAVQGEKCTLERQWMGTWT